MKKKLILILALFLLTGCYDYQELKDLAIISGIAIDYQEEEYHVTLEILNNKKQKDNEAEDKTYYIESRGKTLSDAIMNSSKEIAKFPYFAHLKIVLLSKEVMENHTEEMIDFFLRQATSRNDFYILGGNEEVDKVLKTVSKSEPVASTAIANLLEDNKLKKSIGIKTSLEKFVEDIKSEGKDAVIPSVYIKEDAITLGGMIAFKDEKAVLFLTEEETEIYNLLTKTDSNKLFVIPYEEKNLTISVIANKKPSIEAEKENVSIEAKFLAQVIENTTSIDLKKVESYSKIEELYNPLLEKNIYQFLKKIKEKETDILGIGEIYYKKYRTYPKWTDLKLEVETKIEVNKNGLIFEVQS